MSTYTTVFGQGTLPPGVLILTYVHDFARRQSLSVDKSFELACLGAVTEHLSSFHERADPWTDVLTNTKQLVQEAAIVARNQQKDVLDGQVFQAVLASGNLCPLWPFC